MAAGPLPEDLPVQRMRDPGQRVPVGGMEVGEGPGDGLHRQSLLHVVVFANVRVVVGADELMAGRLAENQKRGQGQQARDGGNETAMGRPNSQWGRCSLRLLPAPLSVVGTDVIGGVGALGFPVCRLRRPLHLLI